MHSVRKVAENKFEVVFVAGQFDPWQARALSSFTTFDAAAAYASYLNGGSQPRADAEVLYIQGQGVSSDNNLYPLLVSTRPDYPIVSLRALQIINQGTFTALIGLYDGNNVNLPLGFAGATGNQVNSYTYDPGILTSIGNDLYFSLQQGQGPVNIAAQGRTLPRTSSLAMNPLRTKRR